MPQLDEQAALALAGGDVTTLAQAADVEAVTAEHVATAEEAARIADERATQSEHAALAGKGSPVREAARFASLRAAVTRRRAERHAQAERLRQLDAVGADAAKHGGELKALRDATLADLATIEDLRRQISERIAKWNGQLADLIAAGAALAPEKPRPGMVPAPSSAHVYAAASSPVLSSGTRS